MSISSIPIMNHLLRSVGLVYICFALVHGGITSQYSCLSTLSNIYIGMTALLTQPVAHQEHRTSTVVAHIDSAQKRTRAQSMLVFAPLIDRANLAGNGRSVASSSRPLQDRRLKYLDGKHHPRSSSTLAQRARHPVTAAKRTKISAKSPARKATVHLMQKVLLSS